MNVNMLHVHKPWHHVYRIHVKCLSGKRKWVIVITPKDIQARLRNRTRLIFRNYSFGLFNRTNFEVISKRLEVSRTLFYIGSCMCVSSTENEKNVNKRKKFFLLHVTSKIFPVQKKVCIKMKADYILYNFGS